MEDTKAQIEKLRKHLKELRALQREEVRAARAALPKKKPGRKPISPAILSRAIKLAEKLPLTEVALRCDIALTTLYNYGISRKSLNEMKAEAPAKTPMLEETNNSNLKLTAEDLTDIRAAKRARKGELISWEKVKESLGLS